MSGLPVELEYQHDQAAQVTPADRDNVSARLNDAFTRGDIDMQDYQTRLNALFQATQKGQLVPVIAGLPAQYRANEPVLGGDQAAKPGELAPIGRAPSALVKAGVGASAALVVLIILLVVLL